MGGGELLSNWYRVLVWKDEKVLGLNGGDGWKTMSMYFMLLNCTLRSG